MSTRNVRAALLATFGLLSFVLCLDAEPAQAAPCDLPIQNEIVCENSKPGDPASEWDVSGAGESDHPGLRHRHQRRPRRDGRLQGRHRAPTTTASTSTGWATTAATAPARSRPSSPRPPCPQTQPNCLDEPSTGLVDCGNWARLRILGRARRRRLRHLLRQARPRGRHRRREPHLLHRPRRRGRLRPAVPDLGHDLAGLQPVRRQQPLHGLAGSGRAYKVSYNRPFTTRGPTPEDSPFNAEYPMVRWLERNGYDVSYFTGVDSDRSGAEILEHEAFLSVGHDEYWSAGQRQNVTAARDAGVNLAFFSGNEVVLEDALGEQHRRLRHRPPHARLLQGDPRQREDRPEPELDRHLARRRARSTPRARSPRTRSPGTIFTVNSGTSAIEVPAAEGKLRLWRNTNLAALAPGQTATLGDEHARLRVGRGPRQRRPPTGADPALLGDPLRSREAPGQRLDLRVRHRDPPPDAVPRGQRRARLRRRHGPVVVGPRRRPRPRQLDPRPAHAAGDREPVRRHGRPARRPAAGADRRQAPRPTPPPRAPR